MRTRTNVTGSMTVLTVALLLAGLPADGFAQAVDEPWIVDGRGGISVPAGDFADLADVGPSFGLGIGYRVHPRVTLRVDGDVGIFTGSELATGAEAPDMNLWHYNGGVEVELTPPDASRWDVTANLAAGATTFSSDDFAQPLTNPATGEVVTDFSSTYFTANGGLKLGYDVSRNVAVYAGGQWYLAFTDEDDTAVFSALSPTEIEPFDTASEIPIVVGLKATF